MAARLQQDEIAASIETVATAMRRHVDRELARARIQSGRPVERGRSRPDPAADRRPAPDATQGAGIDWRLDAVPGLRARIDADDLTRRLARFWKTPCSTPMERVAISTRREGPRIVIAIRDDGRGVPRPTCSACPAAVSALIPTGGGRASALPWSPISSMPRELAAANARPDFTSRTALRRAARRRWQHRVLIVVSAMKAGCGALKSQHEGVATARGLGRCMDGAGCLRPSGRKR